MLRRTLFLASVLLILGAQTAHADMPDWTGEWGQFAVKSFRPLDCESSYVERYVGWGLTIRDCNGSSCQFEIEVVNSEKDATASMNGPLEITGPGQAVLKGLDIDGVPKCILSARMQPGPPGAIHLEKIEGNCSIFAVKGADFLHDYPLYSHQPFASTVRKGAVIAPCFADLGPSKVAVCNQAELDKAFQAWQSVWVNFTSNVPHNDRCLMPHAEEAIFQKCDKAADVAACLKAELQMSAVEATRQKEAWIGGITDPGDKVEAKHLIRKISGIYVQTIQSGLVSGETFTAENHLTLTPISDNQIKVSTDLVFYNGHSCGHDGVATYRKSGAFVEFQEKHFSGDEQCIFEVIPEADGVRLADPTGGCRASECGMRGGYNGIKFGFQEKVRGKVKTTAESP